MDTSYEQLEKEFNSIVKTEPVDSDISSLELEGNPMNKLVNDYYYNMRNNYY